MVEERSGDSATHTPSSRGPAAHASAIVQTSDIGIGLHAETPKPRSTRRRVWLPVCVGIIAALGVFAGLISGIYIPTKVAPSIEQFLLALVASLVSGSFACWQARTQLVGRTGDASTVNHRSSGPVAVRSLDLSQLPSDVDDFTGREEQAEEIAAHLLSGQQASRRALLITVISGKGGIGKTALALHVAHQIRDHFPDAQLYTNLRGAEAQALDPSTVLAGFLRELGVAGTDIPENIDDRARMFRARLSDRRALLVLDNASSEAQVRPLLPGSARCVALVTSRSRLSGLAGSHTVALDAMSAEHGMELLRKVVGSKRVAEEEEASRRIVELCGFLPLALRVAGAKLASRPSWTLGWFAERLKDEHRRLDLLKVGDMEVRASLGLSYDGRGEPEKHAFRLLGILRAQNFPSWNLAALADVPLDDADEIVESLVDAELLEVVGVDASGLIRYRFHDLLRDYAREKLAESESSIALKDALGRLVEAYIGMAREAAAALHPGSLQEAGGAGSPLFSDVVRAEPRKWIVSERRSLVSLIELSAEFGLLTQTWRLAEPLPAMFDVRADWDDWENTHKLGLSAAEETGDKIGAAVMRRSLGMLYRELGRFDEATQELNKSLELFEALDDELSAAVVRRHLGDTHRYQGFLGEAITSFTSALRVFESSGDLRSAAGALNGLADARRGLSQWKQSEEGFDQCIALYRQLDDPLNVARAKVRFSLVFRDRYLNHRAEPLLTDGLRTFRELEDRRWEARTLRHLGIVCRNEGRLDEALNYFDQCLPIFEELLDRRGIAVASRNRGDTYRRAEDYARAEHDLEQALRLFRELDDRRWEARTNLSVADMRRRQERWSEAYDLATIALRYSCEIGDLPAQGRALRQIGMICRDRGDYDEGIVRLKESKRTFVNLGDELWTARVIASLARLEDMRGDDSAALWAEADEICNRCHVIAAGRDECLTEW